MENRTNQAGQQANASQATSYSQDAANRTTSAATQNQSTDQQQGGILETITSGLSNIQVPQAVKNMQLPQAVKDFGATCARTYTSMSTTQKVLGGAALLGASYWAVTSNGWIGQGKKSKNAKVGAKHS